LGSLAFATVLARGVVHAAGFEATVVQAVGMMLAFAIVGCIVGRVAENVVEESVRAKMAEQLAVKAAENSTAAVAKR
jgi:hypothetical protein